MAVYAAGQRLTAADLNVVGAKYHNTSTQGLIVTGTNTRISVPTLIKDYGGIVSISGGNILTLNKTGLWEFKGGFEFESPGAGKTVYAWIGHGTLVTNADRYTMDTRSGSTITAFSLTGEREFTSGDTLAMWVWHDKGSNASTVNTELRAWLAVRCIRGA